MSCGHSEGMEQETGFELSAAGLNERFVDVKHPHCESIERSPLPDGCQISHSQESMFDASISLVATNSRNLCSIR